MKLTSLFFLFFFSFTIVFSQNTNAKFYTLSMKDGLSSNQVTTIFKDSKGLIWIGTKEGLNKYSGFKITSYKSNSYNNNGLVGDNVSSIIEDKQGVLWIGTSTGLNRFNRETETFTHFFTHQKSLSQNVVKVLFVDYQGYVWVGYEGKLVKFNPKTKKIVPLSNNNSTNKFLSNKTAVCIFEDSNKNLWIGTWDDGLLKVDADRSKAIFYINNPSNSQSLPYNRVSALYEDKNKQLWVGHYNAVLSVLNPETGEFTYLKNNLFADRGEITSILPMGSNQLWICQGKALGKVNNMNLNDVSFQTTNIKDPHGFTADYAVRMYKDNTGIVWMATTHGGVSIYDPNRDKFAPFLHQIGSEDETEKYYVNTLCIDKQDNAWIGTYQKGLFFYNTSNNAFTHYGGSDLGVLEESITAICYLKSGFLLLGTLDGILIFNPQTRKKVGFVEQYKSASNNNLQQRIKLLYQDRRGGIWVATEKDIGLIEGERFTRFSPQQIISPTITQLTEDRAGNIWIATGSGLVKYDWKTKRTKQYSFDASKKNTINFSMIHCVYKDTDQTLWVGTREGLSYYNPKADVFQSYRFKPPLLDQNIYQIIEDQKMNLWLMTESGLSKLNRKTGEMNSYNEGDGLYLNPHLLSSDSRGNLFAASKSSGFYRFNPDKIRINLVVPPVIINGLSIMNKPVEITPNQDNGVLQKHISLTSSIELKYDQSVLGFELAALNFTLPEKNQLAYQLVGFDKDWIYTTADKRYVTYTNLSAGTYTLRVMGSNNDGVWNTQPTSIQIVVLPPFWRTYWAYLIYLVLVGLSLYAYRYYSILRFQEKANAEMSALKLRFFTNVSHEFRTPLTLILSPLINLKKELVQDNFLKERFLEHLGLIERNANRLLVLINQILDLQKANTGKLKLEFSQGDLIPFMQSLYSSFELLALQKGIQFQFKSTIKQLNGNFDFDKLEKIVTNLLSNAFKFTNDIVTFSLQVESNKLIIEVSDNGVGIPPEKEKLIFDEFYQIKNDCNKSNEGSGLGLALTQDLVKLHGGSIHVQNETEKGTKLTVIIPLNIENLDVDNTSLVICNELPIIPNGKLLQKRNNRFDSENPDTHLPLILVVEDNLDLRGYIYDVLYKNFRVMEAENGKVGLDKALEQIPDLIISDIMMPEMDGIELCGVLKNDVRTSHIPIILLTAFSAIETKIIGLETGADDYITKPFDAEILLVRIKNLIDGRRQLQLKFQHDIVNTTKYTSNEMDEQFLKKAMELVEQNLENEDFEIQSFIKGMGLSRTSLYVKLKALTGQSVSEFIITARLRNAAQLLLKGHLNISEVYYKVGFQSRSHFNESFKNQYNMTPTEFIKKNKH